MQSTMTKDNITCKQFVANRWLVYIASLLVTIVDFGIMFALGVMFVPMMDKFQASRPATALVQSLMIGMTGLCILDGVLISRYGLHKMAFAGCVLMSCGFIFAYFAVNISHLYILISTIAGIGSVTMFMCATVAVAQVFEGKARLTAVAVQMSGVGFGATCYPFLLHYLTAQYGVGGTYLILGGMYLNNICVVILFRKRDVGRSKESKIKDNRKQCIIKNDEYHDNDQNETLHASINGSSSIPIQGGTRTCSSVDTTAVTTRSCTSTCTECHASTQLDQTHTFSPKWMCRGKCFSKFSQELKRIVSVPYALTTIATVIGQSSLDGYATVFVDIYIWKTYTQDQGTGSALSYQILTCLCRVLAGCLRQIKGFDSLTIPLIGTLLGCCGIIIIYVSESYIVAYVGTGLLGVSAAGIMAGFSMVVAELVPDEAFGTAFGLVETAIAVFSIATGPIFGAIRDKTQSYAPVLLVIGIMHLLAASFYTMALLWRCLAWKHPTVTNKTNMA